MTAAQNQNVTIYAGDKKSLRFPVGDGTGGPATLASPAGTWGIAPGLKTDAEAAHVLTKTARFVTETISTVQWSVAYVDLDESDTLNIPGVYWHQLRITDGGAPEVVTEGKFTINRLIK